MVNYTTSLDDDDTLWLVQDFIDDVEAKHHNALKDAVIALQTALGITGAFNFTTDAEFTAHEGNPTDINHLTDAQVNALHAVVVAGDLNHNDLANINAGDSYEHITQTQKDALHAVVTTLTHTALTGKNDETDIKHLTDAQQTALHAIVVAGDLNHNDLANINAGDAYEHITQTQKTALHAKYGLLEDLIANEITVIKAIDDASINNTKWDYLADMTEDPQTHMGASNPHSGSASDTELGNHMTDTSTHGVAQVANHAEIASQVSTHAALTASHGVAQIANHAEIASQISTHTSDDNAHHEVFENLVEDQTPQLYLGSVLDLQKGKISLNDTLLTDGTCSGIEIDMYNDSGGQRYFGDFVYVKGTNGGRASFGLADASAAGSMPVVGMVVTTVSNGAVGRVLLYGTVYHSGFPTLTPSTTGMDNVIYVSETTGDLTLTAPTTVNAIVQAIGVAIHGDQIIFNPSFTTVKVTA